MSDKQAQDRLVLACQTNNIIEVKTLVEAGYNPWCPDYFGKTAYQYADRYGLQEICDYLQQKARPFWQDQLTDYVMGKTDQVSDVVNPSVQLEWLLKLWHKHYVECNPSLLRNQRWLELVEQMVERAQGISEHQAAIASHGYNRQLLDIITPWFSKAQWKLVAEYASSSATREYIRRRCPHKEVLIDLSIRLNDHQAISNIVKKGEITKKHIGRAMLAGHDDLADWLVRYM